ncbi:MAG TPA: amidohydrolase [Vicinamibacteria bacterium]|nr:amidohydrolase [Vicinamibacteria bacterium]
MNRGRTGLVSTWISALFIFLAGCAPPVEEQPPADLVLRGGKVVTVDDARPEAEAVAVMDGRVLAVGSNDEIEGLIGPDTEVIELDGNLALPGFIEGHGHFMSLGNAKMILDLTRVKDWNEIVTMVGDAVQNVEPGVWIQGRGWHQEKWSSVPPGAVDGLPNHMGLSEVSPENPVILTHASGHAAFVNQKAMELASITRSTPDPPGGTIVKDSNGQPTGALRETAQRLVSQALEEFLDQRSPEERRADDERRLQLASEELLRKGVTSFHDAGADFATIDFFKEMAQAGRLPVRLYVMVRRESNETMAERLADYKMTNAYDGHLTVRSIKRQIDGALGPHGAWLLEPYEDKPDTTGLVLEPVEDIARTAEIALENGFQVNTHAIGDRANRETLDIYERAFANAMNGGRDLRWRIEHAQHIHPDDVPRFAELGVIASMQGVHCTSDGPWVLKRLGEERSRSGAYVWRDLLDSGAIVTNGTDAPVEDVDPLASFYASLTRVMANGEAFFPEQAMTREEALESYTRANAFAAFEEDVKGSISPGKYADFVVLSKDIMTVPAEEIPTAEVLYTIVGGEVLYKKKT